MLEEEVVVEVADLPQVYESVAGGQQVRRGLALGHEHRELEKKFRKFFFLIKVNTVRKADL